MEAVISTITTKYQVTIPKQIRVMFPKLKPFGKVTVKIENNKIIIEPAKKIENFVGIMGKAPSGKSNPDFSKIRKETYKKLRKI